MKSWCSITTSSQSDIAVASTGRGYPVEQRHFAEDVPGMNDVEHDAGPVAEATLIFTEPASTPMSPVPTSPLAKMIPPALSCVAPYRRQDARLPADEAHEIAGGCGEARTCR